MGWSSVQARALVRTRPAERRTAVAAAVSAATLLGFLCATWRSMSPLSNSTGFSSGVYPGRQCVADDNGELGDPRSACSQPSLIFGFRRAGHTDIQASRIKTIAAA